jgi:hypothetical protein
MGRLPDLFDRAAGILRHFLEKDPIVEAEEDLAQV